MSVAPAVNPVPPRVWRAIKSLLAAHGIAVEERQVAFVDEKQACDEFTAFALLYVKEQ